MINKQKIVSLMDLTRLGDNDTDADIIALCNKADNFLGKVAAICVYKQFIPTVRSVLGTDFKVATVVNFPYGDASFDDVLQEAQEALNLGADEIDLVINYKDYLKNGSSSYSCKLVAQVKKLCQNKPLKVIIESGELQTKDLITKATIDAIANGADFVKTSTGKTPVGATIEAAETILATIQSYDKSIGLKVSGGIGSYDQATKYLKLAMLYSSDCIDAKSFRFGVSGLLDNLLDGEIASDAY